MGKISRVGLDLAKNVFQVHVVDEAGNVIINKQLKRQDLLRWFAKQARTDSCRVGMEACGSSHYWARTLIELGFDARILNPKFVKAYAQGNKNDANDAEAICEAVASSRMKTVPLRTLSQQDMLTLHRRRERLKKQRTALINQTRGLMAEYGVIMAKRVENFYREMPGMLSDTGNKLTPVAREIMNEQWTELHALDKCIEATDKHITRLAKQDENSARLMTIEGVGPVTATATIAHIGRGEPFERARQFANWLGVVPGEHSSGGKTKQTGIHKRGNRYLRTLFVHGARAALNAVNEHSAPRLKKIAATITTKASKNKAIVALANHNARIAFALLRDGVNYEIRHATN